MKQVTTIAVIFTVIIAIAGFGKRNRTPQQGSGIGNNSYHTNEHFQEIATLTAANGAPLGHGHAMMYKGYMVMTLAKDAGKRGGGFGFYDLSNPRNPQAVLTKVDASTEKIREGHGYGFFNINGRDYVALQTIEGLQIWDWTDVLNPTLASNLALPGITESDYALGSWWIATQAKYLYVGGSGNGLYIVNVENPLNPVLENRVPTSRLGGFRVGPVFAIGNLLVISAMDGFGVATVDISDPVNPALLSTDPVVRTFLYSVMVNGNYIIGTGVDRRVHIWDISDPNNMVLKSTSDFLSGGGGYINIQDEFIHVGMSNAYFKLDMSNADSIKVVGNAVSTLQGNIDHDFASVLGNLVIIGNDHGEGSSIVVHDTLADNRPPKVTRVIPAPDAVNQALTSRIGITLSDGIEYTSIDATSFIVRPLGGQPLEGTYSYQFGIINFTPKNKLDPNKVYEVVVPAGGLKDYAGNPIQESFTSQFSTGNSLNIIGCSLKELPFVELGLTSYFEVTPFNNNSNTTTYAWNFGDGTTLTASPNPYASHVYDSAGSYTVLVTISDGLSQSTCNIRHTVYEKLGNNAPASATTLILDESGNYTWNVNPDNNSITKLNIRNYSEVQEFETGNHPVSLAQDALGNIWVANRDDATIQVFSNSGSIIKTITLPRGTQPAALTISPNKQYAYVSLHSTGSVMQIATASGNILNTKKVGRFPKGLAVTRESDQLFVTLFKTETDTAKVIVLDAVTLEELKVINLSPEQTIDSEFGGRGVINYLNSVTLSPDGRLAIVPSKKDNIFRGLQKDGNTLNFENTVRASLSFINLNQHEEDVTLRRDVNNADIPSFNIFSAFGNLIFTSIQGNNRVDVFDAYRGAFLTSIENVGIAPQGMTLSPTGDTLFIHNFLSRTISMYNVDGLVNQSTTEVIKLGEIKTISKETMDAIVLKGKKVFYNAEDTRMNKDGYMSCATCHLDGDDDGRVWDLTQLGEGLRNTIPLVGRGGTKHGRVHWTGNFDEIQDFEEQIRALAGGTGFMNDADFHFGSRNTSLGDTKAGFNEDLDALAAYVNSLNKFGKSPYKNQDGTLTEAGLRGKQIFAEKQCGLCHSGNEFTDSEKSLLHDIGTITTTTKNRLHKPVLGFDTQTLKGLWMSSPYMHNGSAKTLYEIFDAGNGDMIHTGNYTLTTSEKEDLVAYLLQLDDNEKGSSPFMNLQIISPENFTTISTNMAVDVKVKTDLKDITKVEYYVNGDLFKEANNVTDKIQYQFTVAGEYFIQAKVFHNNGKWASVTAETKITVLDKACDIGIELMPNPVTNKLRVGTNGVNASVISIYDYNGKRWLQQEMKNTSEVINFDGLQTGLYFVVVEKNGCKTVKKVLKY